MFPHILLPLLSHGGTLPIRHLMGLASARLEIDAVFGLGDSPESTGTLNECIRNISKAPSLPSSSSTSDKSIWEFQSAPRAAFEFSSSKPSFLLYCVGASGSVKFLKALHSPHPRPIKFCNFRNSFFRVGNGFHFSLVFFIFHIKLRFTAFTTFDRKD